MQEVNENTIKADESFESEYADENYVNETFEGCENVDKLIETDKFAGLKINERVNLDEMLNHQSPKSPYMKAMANYRDKLVDLISPNTTKEPKVPNMPKVPKVPNLLEVPIESTEPDNNEKDDTIDFSVPFSTSMNNCPGLNPDKKFAGVTRLQTDRTEDPYKREEIIKDDPNGTSKDLDVTNDDNCPDKNPGNDVKDDLQDLKDDPKDHKSHSCKYCGKIFEYFKSFQEHEETQDCIKQGVYPKLVLKRLSESLTHPYQCNKCPQKFHKVQEATAHYIATHQNSNNLPENSKNSKHSKHSKHSKNSNHSNHSKDSKKVCRCGSGKRKVRCKKCEGCFAKKCNQCQFCLKPSMKKSCVKRECHYQVVPASCKEAFRQVCLKQN